MFYKVVSLFVKLVTLFYLKGSFVNKINFKKGSLELPERDINIFDKISMFFTGYGLKGVF